MKLFNYLITGFYFFTPILGIAAGMVPETSLLIIHEDQQGASMDIKNTDADTQLLYTQIIDLPEDVKPSVIVTQPVVRVEPGKVQRVRFVLQNGGKSLTKEHFKRVIFATIPQREKNKLKVVFSQNLPVIIHPTGLKDNPEPWKQLSLKKNNGYVDIKNDTPYVVRMEQHVKLLPSGVIQYLSKSYILPGENMIATGTPFTDTDNQVQLFPVSRYGYQSDKYTAELKL